MKLIMLASDSNSNNISKQWNTQKKKPYFIQVIFMMIILLIKIIINK